MEKELIQQVLIIDRLLDGNIQSPNAIAAIRKLAARFRETQPELVKESDIISQKFTQLLSSEVSTEHTEEDFTQVGEPKVSRLYIDGCFDLMHSGHFNAIRQAKAMADTLVVGVISSEAIGKAKGPPIMSDKERVALVKSCKWVDEIVEGVAYDPTIELLDKLNCSHVAHGDDLVQTSDGQDAYYPFKKAGRMKIFKRTEGISTTDIVGRLLLMTKEIMWEEKKVFRRMSDSAEGLEASNIQQLQQQQEPSTDEINFLESSLNSSKILNTTRRIRQFSNNKKPRPQDKIVYVDGSFDILHEGHIQVLEKAKALGDFLYVGVYDNETINNLKGKNYPILNLQERVLNLLAIKYVDEVIIGAPYLVTENMIKNLKIHVVAEGSTTVHREEMSGLGDPYEVPRRLGIYHVIESDVKITADELAERIVKNRLKYMQKFSSKKKKDLAFEENHEYLLEEI